MAPWAAAAQEAFLGKEDTAGPAGMDRKRGRVWVGRRTRGRSPGLRGRTIKSQVLPDSSGALGGPFPLWTSASPLCEMEMKMMKMHHRDSQAAPVGMSDAQSVNEGAMHPEWFRSEPAAAADVGWPGLLSSQGPWSFVFG